MRFNERLTIAVLDRMIAKTGEDGWQVEARLEINLPRQLSVAEQERLEKLTSDCLLSGISCCGTKDSFVWKRDPRLNLSHVIEHRIIFYTLEEMIDRDIFRAKFRGSVELAFDLQTDLRFMRLHVMVEPDKGEQPIFESPDFEGSLNASIAEVMGVILPASTPSAAKTPAGRAAAGEAGAAGPGRAA